MSQLERGNNLMLADFLADTLHRPAYFSEGMGMSVQCVEEAPFTTEAAIKAKIHTLPPQLARLSETTTADNLEICAAWQVEAAAPLENEPVVSSIPTLILAGDYDPITPPSFAKETAASLSNAFYFEFTGVAHGVIGSHKCGRAMAVAFLARPSGPPDASCLPSTHLGFIVQ